MMIRAEVKLNWVAVSAVGEFFFFFALVIGFFFGHGRG